jgi:predicted MFS family arabinose efflux permease
LIRFPQTAMTLVSHDRLIEANGRPQATASAAEVGGPGIAGLVVQSLGAPFALALDAASYVVSAVTLRLIRVPEPESVTPTGPRDLHREIVAGVRFLRGQPMLRACAMEAGQFNLFAQVITSVLLLHATRDIGLGPVVIGLAFAIGSVGSLIGAALAPRIAVRIGLGRTIIGSMVVACAAPLLLPVAAGTSIPAVMLAFAFAVQGLGVSISNVHIVSLRQAVTPDTLRGRLNASYRTLVYGAIPIGALLGGLLGELIGQRATLAVGAIGILLAPLWVAGSPLRGLRRLPDDVALEEAR